jgi:Glycoside-hydrolase family GH114
MASDFGRCFGVLGLALGLALACDGTDGVLVTLQGSAAGEDGSGEAGRPPVEPADEPYVPAESARWLARLDGPVDIGQDAEFFYLDAELQAPGDLAELRRQGRHYLCYLSAGSFEAFRGDAAQFPESAIGNPLAAFPGERWLDVRDATVRQLMAARIERLAELGCAGVPPSALPVHTADTGFALTLEDALEYSRWVAERLHASGMSAGLVGPASLTSPLWASFDFGLAIGCVADTQCAEYEVLRQGGRPVFFVELGAPADAERLCKSAQALGFYPLITDAGFSGECTSCRDIL